jgi:glycerol-3-phosphate dehydrogenase
MTRTQVTQAQYQDDGWLITCQDMLTNKSTNYRAKMLVNASGPWVQQVINERLHRPSAHQIRLVRGSHIVVPKLYDHDQPYILQGHDGRIVFLLPFEQDYTLIGTTDIDHQGPPDKAECTDAEAEYLCQFVNEYIKNPIKVDDIVWRFAGVRPLFDDGNNSASEATRDYVLELQNNQQAPLLNVFGGKITTYRKLAEAAMEALLPNAKKGHWTATAPLPGGDFAVDGRVDLANNLRNKYTYLSDTWAYRLVTTYGTDSFALLGECLQLQQLGKDFGATLTQTEIAWLLKHEFAKTAEDIIWRRTKLGLQLTPQQIQDIADWVQDHQDLAA